MPSDLSTPLQGSATLEDFLRAVPDPVVVTDLEGRIGSVNDAAEEFLGYARAELEGQLADVVLSASVRALLAVPPGAQALARAPAPRPAEVTVRRRDGRLVEAEATLQLVPSDRGALVLVFLHDISKRKGVEAQLRRSQRLLEAAQGLASIGSFEWDVAKDRISWSDEMHRIHGTQPEAFRATYEGLLELVHPDDRASIGATASEALRTRGPFTLSYRVVRPDGEVRYLESWGRVESDAEGKAARVFGAAQDVTQRRAAERALGKSQELLVQAGRLSHVGSWTWDTVSNESEWSDEFFRILGLEPGSTEPNFEAFLERVLPEDTERLLSKVEALVRRGEPLNHEFRVVRPDGAVRFVHAIAESLLDEGGRLVRARGALQDLTERKAADEQRHQSDERYRIVAETASDALLTVGEDGRIVLANPAADRIFGYAPGELAGHNVTAIMPAGLRPRHLDGFGRYLKTGQRALDWRSIELTGLAKDGREFPVEISFGESAVGSRRSFTAIIRDTTERKRAEQAIRQYEQRFETIFRDSPMGIWLSAFEDGRILEVNDACLRLLGYTRGELLGLQAGDLLVWPKGVPRGEFLESLRAKKGARELEMPYRTKAGEVRHGVFVFTVVSLDGAPAVLKQFYDVTARREAEEELARRMQELARSNADLELFAYIASHDLKAPLRQVQSYLQLLKRRYGGRLEADADEFIGFAGDAARRMEGLLDALLAYSRAGASSGPVPETDAGEAARAAAEDLREVVEAQGAAVVIGPLPRVRADPDQLRELFQNLVSNALKFRGSEPPRVEVFAARDGDAWRVSVRDNGIGIDPAYHARVFVTFQRLQGAAKVEGAGIGLAVCKKIVERHGGRIWVESQAGQGATFNFTLPDVPPEVP